MTHQTIRAATAAVALLAAFGPAAHGQAVSESFETLVATGPSGPPGTTVALSSGNWFFVNSSTPIGSTGLSPLPGTSTTVFTPPVGGGTVYASMNFNNGSGLATINSFLMTPQLNLVNGSTFTFQSRTVDGASFPDRLRLLLSTAGASTNTTDFTTVLLSINEGLTATGYPSVWTTFTATLSGLPAGASGRFAFNYNVPNGGPSGANSDLIGIDLVNYTPVPEPGSMALAGMAVAGGFGWHRRRKAAV